MFARSYVECPIAVAYLKEKLITEDTALTLAGLDVDIEIVRQRFRLMDRETASESAAARRKVIAGLVKDFVYRNGVVPVGEPTRWQIHSEAAAIKRENALRGLDEVEDEPEFPGDPRFCRGNSSSVALKAG